MASHKAFRTIGLMSGTSGDGVDAAYLETDGHGLVRTGDAITLPYAPEFRRRLMSVMGKPDEAAAIEQELTELHARAVEILLMQMGKTADEIDLIGFHGQTILHNPAERRTVQMGDGATLAAATGIAVVNDFRSADVAAGGQGAPLVPLYHAAIASGWEKPCAIVNIGGVANVTYLNGEAIIACDTGPGCALIDDAMQNFFGMPCDVDGDIAAMGSVNEDLLNMWLVDAFFAQPAPKSLDRNHFKRIVFPLPLAPSREGRGNVGLYQMSPSPLAGEGWGGGGIQPDDFIATLTEFTARSILESAKLFPAPPREWVITGGGRKNKHLMSRLVALASAPVLDITDKGWDGDALEAQAFGYLAARHMLKLPLSLPTTTGVPVPMLGGVFHAINSASTP